MTAPSKEGAPCPICRKPMVTAFRPFCSKLCASRDLIRWIDGGYRIPTEECPDGVAATEEGMDEDGRGE